MTVKGSLDCGSCQQPFDLAQRRPKVLPCGHTCCRGCLLGRETGVRCPEDNTTFVRTVDELMDNLYVISAIGRDSHLKSSSKRSLALLELAARRLQEELAALPGIRSQLLAALNSSVDHVLKQQLQVLQCLARLRLASGTPESWQQHREEAHRLLETEEPQRQGLRQDLRLLRGGRLAARAALEPRRPGSLSAAAEAELQLEEQPPALRLAATLLRQQGDLPLVQYKEEVVRLPRGYLLGISCWSTESTEDKALLLETSTKFVHFKSRLYCDDDPAWSLLHHHSTTLTYLRLDDARLEYIAAVWELTALEELEISMYEKESQATETHSGQPLQWPPPGPSKARRLWRAFNLRMPWSVAAVLLAAHRDSLLDVDLWSYETIKTLDQLEATAAILRQCDVYRLRSIGLAFVELTEEEADVLRAALPEGCHLGYRVKVDRPPPPPLPRCTIVPKRVHPERGLPKRVVQPERVEPDTAGLEEEEEEEEDVDIGLGLFV